MKKRSRLLSIIIMMVMVLGVCIPTVARAETKNYTNADGLRFECNTETGEATLVEATNTGKKIIEIPSSINGYTVTRIEHFSLKIYGVSAGTNTSGSEVRYIIIPTSIKSMGSDIFYTWSWDQNKNVKLLYKGTSTQWEMIEEDPVALYNFNTEDLYMKNEWSMKNGLQKASDGKWKYFKNYVIDRTATGLVQKTEGGTWHYVKNGLYTKATGMVKCIQPGSSSQGKWYYVEKGDLSKKSGMVKCIQPGSSQGKWYYVYKGKLKANATGVVKCIQPGASNGKYYYVKEGKLQSVKGVAKVIQPGDSNKGKLFYVKKGKFKKFTGYSRRLDNNKKVYVVNGVVKK